MRLGEVRPGTHFARLEGMKYGALHLIAISFFFGSVSAPAAESCQSVFLNPGILSLTRADYDPVINTFVQYAQTQSPLIRTLAIAHLRTVEKHVASVLREQKIAFEIVRNEDPLIDGIDFYQFIILPEGTHNLNKMAASLQKKTGVRLAFNPLFNKLAGFVASFYSVNKTLYVSQEAILGQADSNLGHEAIHAHFWASKKGVIEFLPKAPVRIEMTSAKGIRKSSGYSRYMSFEEMMTYAFNISYTGRQLQKTNDVGTAQLIRGLIQQLQEVSENSLLSSVKGQELIAKQSYTVIEKDSMNFLVAESADKEFKLQIFIPKGHVENAKNYALLQLENAMKLAHFNQRYFGSLANKSESEILTSSRAFRGEQKKFILSLP